MANKAQLARSAVRSVQNQEQYQQRESGSWKPVAYGLGAVFGILVGVVAAHLYTQAVEQNQDVNQAGSRPQISPLDMISLGTMLLGVIRHITDLGARSASKR